MPQQRPNCLAPQARDRGPLAEGKRRLSAIGQGKATREEVRGNIWNVPAVLPNFDAEWIAGVVGNNIFRVNPGQNSLFLPGYVSPIDWFFQDGQPNYECSTGMPQCPSVNMQGGGGERSQPVDEAVMQGVIQNGIYTDETRLTLAYELYMAMDKDPSLYAGGPYTATFLSAMDNAVAADLKEVEVPRKELYDMPTPVEQAVEQNLASIDALLAQVKGAMAQLEAGGLSAAQIAAMQADIDSWHQIIENLNTYNTTAMANLDAARQAQAQLLEGGAAALASSELIEQNAKQVNEIYLSTIAVTGEDLVFDAGQAATLYTIANQCPLVGGNPVYQARSLYSLVDETMDFDDALLCVAAGYAVKNEDQEGPQVVVFPNPTRDGQLFFRIVSLGDVEDPGEIRLFDVQGQEVARRTMASNWEQVDVSGLAQGLYTWSVSVKGGETFHGKVTIY